MTPESQARWKKRFKGLLNMNGGKQDPNADTEWNDILCKKGILPPKGNLKELEKEEAEKEEQALPQQSVVKAYEEMTLEKLEENEDEFNEEDERAIELAEWKVNQLRNKYGEVLEISGKDYAQEVTRLVTASG
ncbi:hypothetical protein U0070_026171 [Myodes glareolus]|uniref:Uncharacterized protein n=1 Tax=Myodes glareolus TaxID=447135 RepID=A0AAW0HWU7_MYOGA